jgi:uncharacterized membrane protein
MADENLTLYVASYADSASASSDYEDLKDAESTDELVIVGSVVLSRDDDGKITMNERGGGQVAGGGLFGGAAGLVVGLFAPPLLLSTAIGAGTGAVIGELSKKHEEKKMGVDVEEYLPSGTSAIVVVLDDQYLDGVDRALTRADRKVNKAIDSGDYDKIQKAISEAGDDASDAVDL